MKYLTMCLVCFLLATGCSQKTNFQKKALDPANMDLSVRPGDDFYQFANGTWMKNNPIPDEFSRYGAFEELREMNLNDLHTIMKEAANKTDLPTDSNIRKIGDFYATGMAEAKIETEGLTSLKPEFEIISQIKSIEDVQRIIAYFHKYNISPLFNFFPEQDFKNSDMYIGWLYQGGLGLPDRDYYTDKSSRSEEIRAEYIKHVQRMFELLGDSPDIAAQNAQTVMDIEIRLAKVSMTLVKQRNPKAIYNPMSLPNLQRLTPNYNWVGYFKSIGLDNPGTLNIGQPKFFKEINKMITQISVDKWKTYLRWNLINETAGYLNSDFVDANFNFYGKFLTGAKELRPRWKRVLETTSHSLGEAVGQIYVETYFPPEAREQALDLVMNLKDAYAERIKKLDWMSAETKQKALEKLNSFTVKIGYPDKWINYSSIEIDRKSYVINVLNARSFKFNRDKNKIGKPVDKAEWLMTPQTVNAYYNPASNEIVFPAAILQSPFFNFKADDPVNYGAIGAFIGHEMTHGFDDQGRQYDKDGNLNDWWMKEDEIKFNKRVKILIEQADDYAAIDTFKINGKLTLGENIADLGGLTIAYDALQMAMKKNPPDKVIDGFTPEQRFFLSWAQVWRSNIRRENLLLRLKTDVHSPAKYRTNAPLSNLPIFFTAFNVHKSDKMYRPEDQIAKIWA